MVYPRIHDPVLYEWDLNETHDRYDYPKAWPSSGRLHVEFSILAAINALTASFVFLLIVALLRSKRVRSVVFNMYLLFIAIPDFWVSFLCFITCAMSAQQSQFYSEWMCGFQSFYLNWAFISNAWLNGVVVFQIHRMLRFSRIRRRYSPPTHRQVFGHAAIVYAYATFWGILCGFNLKFLPHSSHLYYGFACMPMEYNRASSLFFWLVYLPFSLGIPLLFAACVMFDIVRNKLMPPTGKRRALSMFLLRLCFLYFAIWLPFLILFLVGNFVVINPLIHWIGAAISHLQGLFSALFCLTNKDIHRSFVLLVSCQPASTEDRRDSSDLYSGHEGGETSRSSLERCSNRGSMSRVISWVLGGGGGSQSGRTRSDHSLTVRSEAQDSRLSVKAQQGSQQEQCQDEEDVNNRCIRDEEPQGNQKGQCRDDDEKGERRVSFLAGQTGGSISSDS